MDHPDRPTITENNNASDANSRFISAFRNFSLSARNEGAVRIERVTVRRLSEVGWNAESISGAFALMRRGRCS